MHNARKWIAAIFLGAWALPAHALMELDLDISYDRLVYGESRQNKMIDRTFSGSLDWYLFRTTALELNYSREEQTDSRTENTELDGTTLTLVSVRNEIKTNVYGVGIRQALLPLTFRLRPMISLGYARQFTEDSTRYAFDDSASGNQIYFLNGPFKRRVDSVFMTFMLQWKLGERVSLKGSVRTVFPAFNYDSARDNLKYTAGLAIFF